MNSEFAKGFIKTAKLSLPKGFLKVKPIGQWTREIAEKRLLLREKGNYIRKMLSQSDRSKPKQQWKMLQSNPVS